MRATSLILTFTFTVGFAGAAFAQIKMWYVTAGVR